MIRSLLILVVVLMVFSCENKPKLINKSQFQNKTFNAIMTTEKDTMVFAFKDSTYEVYDGLWGEHTWGISHYNHLNLLVLNEVILGINNYDDGIYHGTLIGDKDREVNLVERKMPWKKSFVLGNWTKKSNKSQLYDSIRQLPVPPPSEKFSEKDFVYPGYYEILNDSIKYHIFNTVTKSAYEINNTHELLFMDLHGESFEHNWKWFIKSLSDSVMIVERKITKIDSANSDFVIDTLVRNKRY
ncbi:hypothetical protein ACG2LH_11400 [Zhouia sp. PK063]|uniref:hypothetical protein n=1 Tax=Zhouia sp. PK063 TaxID=3373602 RepID=UPI0037B1B6A3